MLLSNMPLSNMPRLLLRAAPLVVVAVATAASGCADTSSAGDPEPGATSVASAQEAEATTAATERMVDPDRVRAEVHALLDAQVEAWNRGDVEGYMAGYWESAELRFASGGEVTHGWQETLERYRRRYPDRAAMGRLSFADLDVRPLGPRWAAVHGRWLLEREQDAPDGLFTLLVERRPEGWRIVHDHTSSGP